MKKNDRPLFSVRLHDLRKKHNLTQEEVANKLHLCRPTYTCYETGTSTPGLNTLCEIADLFEVNVDYLVGRPHTGEQSIADTPSANELLSVIETLGDNEKRLVYDLVLALKK